MFRCKLGQVGARRVRYASLEEGLSDEVAGEQETEQLNEQRKNLCTECPTLRCSRPRPQNIHCRLSSDSKRTAAEGLSTTQRWMDRHPSPTSPRPPRPGPLPRATPAPRASTHPLVQSSPQPSREGSSITVSSYRQGGVQIPNQGVRAIYQLG